MRIIKREEFLALKDPVLFCKVEGGCPYAILAVKGDSVPAQNDFWYLPMLDDDWFDNPTVVGDAWQRDGCFDGDSVGFAVFEDADYRRLSSLISQLTGGTKIHGSPVEVVAADDVCRPLWKPPRRRGSPSRCPACSPCP